ncbi:putative integral membrane protein Pth11-like [Aspergillus affinis]|uniref:putative integral membrane protein Pth11-like n=1 Tax=Aspergillus affinis TaxID=1070780 RepID=UPI0022FDEFDD|nr:uncharacterized protein KD926_007375 [Aspergillus affinis]KAI9041105.1 hypothetical protein KD926_007375 [Aspergillus affinis]
MASDSQGPVVAGIAVGFLALTIIVLSLRMFSRVVVLGKMGIDDYLIIGACLFSWSFSAVTVVAVKNGLGSHLEDVDPSHLETYAFVVWLSSMFYLSTLGFIKSSVCVFYTRLGDRYLTRLSLVMLVVVVAQALSFVLTAAFQCNPIPKAWSTALPGKCVQINVFYLANTALNILTDLLSYSLPARIIFRLQMPMKQKIALAFILCLGLFACVSSIIRITYIPAMLTSPDTTHAISDAMCWSVIEINVGIFASSIPSFKAITSRFLPRLVGEYSSGKGYYWPGNSKKYGSGFSKVRDQRIALDNMPGKHPDGEHTAGTEIHEPFGNSTSKERIIIPEGRIYTRTDIETSVEECPTAGSPRSAHGARFYP